MLGNFRLGDQRPPHDNRIVLHDCTTSEVEVMVVGTGQVPFAYSLTTS
ncbi:hypothetical protein LINPERHAP1_LOCUS24399, partial [Linum perenne]